MKKLFVMLIILLSANSWAKEPISQFDKVPDDEWPSQVIFDTVHVCYNGIVRWIAMGNPQLMNMPPPPYVARVMTVHCFCVMDMVRTDYKYKAYVDFINNDSMEDPKLLPKLFMKKSLECIKEHGTLAGLVMLDEEALRGLDEYAEDNATKVEKKVDPPDNNSGKSDSPEQPEELPTEESPILSF
tara:strand:+ start:75 stop:629 length:555 start_codon:yes stop_codon:yes gene_type:complete